MLKGMPLTGLQVNMSGVFSPGLAQSLRLLRSLETLDLTAVGCMVPALDLSPLQRLYKLALFGAAPESLQLPAGCEVGTPPDTLAYLSVSASLLPTLILDAILTCMRSHKYTKYSPSPFALGVW